MICDKCRLNLGKTTEADRALGNLFTKKCPHCGNVNRRHYGSKPKIKPLTPAAQEHLENVVRPAILKALHHGGNELSCVCGECNHKWVETFPMPMLVESFCSRLKHTLCPQCGSGKVMIPL